MSCHRERIAQALGYHFARPELLDQALTHRSFGATHNERLEFLGDAVLGCCIAQWLYRRYGDLAEGELSRHRASLVCQQALVAVAARLTLGACLRLGEGELKSGGAQRPSILADAVEAIIGAVFLDAGFDAASRVVERLWQPMFAEFDPRRSSKDAKTALQEILQGRRLPLPVYALLATEGAAHDQDFTVECRIDALGLCVIGRGKSRRVAEQDAARAALERMP